MALVILKTTFLINNSLYNHLLLPQDSQISNRVNRNLSRYLDYFNILCFDFKMYFDESEEAKKLGHHSPLHSKDSETMPDLELTVVSGEKVVLFALTVCLHILFPTNAMGST